MNWPCKAAQLPPRPLLPAMSLIRLLPLPSVSWNGNPPKYDIRDWSPDGSRMAKGISLTEDELKTLKGILDDMEL